MKCFFVVVVAYLNHVCPIMSFKLAVRSQAQAKSPNRGTVKFTLPYLNQRGINPTCCRWFLNFSAISLIVQQGNIGLALNQIGLISGVILTTVKSYRCEINIKCSTATASILTLYISTSKYNFCYSPLLLLMLILSNFTISFTVVPSQRSPQAPVSSTPFYFFLRHKKKAETQPSNPPCLLAHAVILSSLLAAAHST